jgi:hypothetical protein
MGVFCVRLKFGSTAALDSRTGQNKGRYCKKALLLLLVSLYATMLVLGLPIQFLNGILSFRSLCLIALCYV